MSDADIDIRSENETEEENDDVRPEGELNTSAEPPEEQLLRTKRIRRNKPFNEELLISEAGISRIYHEFPLAIQYQARGSEAAFLKRLITLYKEWAFQLHPGVSFNDAILKCEGLGPKAAVRNSLQHLRDLERERYINDVLLPIAREQDAQAQAALAVEKEALKQQLRDEKKEKRLRKEQRRRDRLASPSTQTSAAVLEDTNAEPGTSAQDEHEPTPQSARRSKTYGNKKRLLDDEDEEFDGFTQLSLPPSQPRASLDFDDDENDENDEADDKNTEATAAVGESSQQSARRSTWESALESRDLLSAEDESAIDSELTQQQ